MATSQRPLGIAHVTVVPTNADRSAGPAVEDAESDEDADAES